MQTGTENLGPWRALAAAVVYRAFPRRRLIAALALALLAHGALYEFAPTPEALLRTRVPATPVELVRAEEKIPDELLPEEFREKPRFVPANPSAPPATPPDTPNHAAADARAAQEIPDPNSRDRVPTHNGELEDSTAVFDDAIPPELLPPELRAPQIAPTPKPNSPAAERAVPAEESAPDPGADVPAARDADAAGTLARGEDAVPAQSDSPEEKSLPEPAPRPQIAPPPGLKMITMRSNSAVNEIGVCSLDAKFSEYGDYTQRMLEAIQAAWYIAIRRTSIVQPPAVVVVEFTLNSDGTVDDARIVFSNASEPAAYACLDAVASRAPFDPWRADMVALVGKENETTRITFHYR